MSSTVRAICTVVDETLILPNTASGSLVLSPGNYLAYPQSGSSPAAYDLYAADAHWAKGEHVGAVFVSVTQQGQAVLS